MSDTIHILLVEDNDADIDLVRTALEATRHDIRLSVAKDGVEAIDFLDGMGSWSEPGCPTLILLDLNLPRKDGRQVLAVLKSEDKFRRIPIVVLSSSNSEADITNSYHLGANSYLVKPGDMKGFRRLMRLIEDFWLGAAKLPRRDGHSNATRIAEGL